MRIDELWWLSIDVLVMTLGSEMQIQEYVTVTQAVCVQGVAIIWALFLDPLTAAQTCVGT